MSMINRTTCRHTLMIRLDHGCDLLAELTRICFEQGITLGQVRAIGAVQKAQIGFYDQQAKEYRFQKIDRPMEIAQLTGNISMKDGKPFVHAHISLAGEDGTTLAGHLAEETLIFACEAAIDVLNGPQLERTFDETTGLGLWSAE